MPSYSASVLKIFQYSNIGLVIFSELKLSSDCYFGLVKDRCVFSKNFSAAIKMITSSGLNMCTFALRLANFRKPMFFFDHQKTARMLPSELKIAYTLTSII